MTNTPQWPSLVLILVLGLGLVGLIAYARGTDHHRGDEVGTHGTKIIIVRPG